jgi:hypothetical protein
MGKIAHHMNGYPPPTMGYLYDQMLAVRRE